jgi:3-oxoadipate enol-lactonase
MMGERSPVLPHWVDTGADGGGGAGSEHAPLVLIGSLGSTLEMWRPQLAAFADRRVVRIDHRGHGGSPVPAGPYSVGELAGDVLALLEQLELPAVDLVGLSLGGMVGQVLATEVPHRLRTLTLLATSAHFPDPTPWTDLITAVSEAGTGSIAEAGVARWFTPEFGRAHPEVTAEARAMLADIPDVGFLACCQAIRDWDHVRHLPEIAVPTLLVAGSADQATPPDPHAETIAAGIPDVRYETVPAAHLLSWERPDLVNALIAAHTA